MKAGMPLREDGHGAWRSLRVVLPLAIGVHLLFWLSLPTGLLDPLFNDSMHRIGKGGDFFQFYQAGAELLRGRTIYQYTVMDSVPYGPFNKYPPLLPATLGPQLGLAGAAQVWLQQHGIPAKV